MKSSFDNGRLANVISYVLCKLGHPVVNDRFGKKSILVFVKEIEKFSTATSLHRMLLLECQG